MLTQPQLDALFKRIADGTDTGGAFAAATPGMSEEERNRWVNMYGSGGTNYKDWYDWYQNNQAALNRTGQAAPLYAPGGIFGGPAAAGGAAAGGPTDVQNPWLTGGGSTPFTPVPTTLTPATTSATGNPTGWSGQTGGAFTNPLQPHTKPGIIQAGQTRPLGAGPALQTTRQTNPTAPAVVQTTATPPPAPAPSVARPFSPPPRQYTLRSVWS